MVVVSGGGGWGKTMAPPYPPAGPEGDPPTAAPATPAPATPAQPQPQPQQQQQQATGASAPARAVLICRPNSHPFQDRTLSLEQPVKVGRSVARAKATPTNAIFDCKVLSRHHAVLWYDAGKFYLQDTKSSNGTFVNNNRLSTSEDLDHQEVSSGDIVQFGVDVVENSNRKVTHGCIIAALKLYLPDGKEAKASPSLIDNNRQGTVPLEDLYELNQIIQDAAQREQCLETKLLALQHVVDEARRSAEDSWQAYVGEERLLSRIAALEAQLSQAGGAGGKNPASAAAAGDSERLRDELRKLHDDQATYQAAAKESLRKLLAERVDAIGAAAEHQRARATAEHEAMLAREELEKAHAEVKELAQKLTEERKIADKECEGLESRIESLKSELKEEKEKVAELMIAPPAFEDPSMQKFQRCNLLIEPDDLKRKEEMINENENENEISNGLDEPQQNHINNTTASKVRFEEKPTDSDDSDQTSENIVEDPAYTDLTDSDTVAAEEEMISEPTSKTYSKTLKYQFQTERNELRKQIENLELLVVSNKQKVASLEAELESERIADAIKTEEIETLRESLDAYSEKFEESCLEVGRLRDQLAVVAEDLRRAEDEKKASERSESDVSKTVERLLGLEEELVRLKEKFVAVDAEKILLNKELESVRGQYKAECDRSQNTLFFYVAPLVLMVLYLLVSSLFS